MYFFAFSSRSSAAVWISVAVLVVYVILSGVHGSAWTAIVKDIMILAVAVGLGIYLPLHYYGSYGAMFAAIEQAHTDVGEILADSWQLTDYLSAVVSEHHRDNKDDMLSRVVELASLVDEMRTNPAMRAAAPIRIQALSKQLGISQIQLADLQLEMKRASTSSLRF